MRKIDFTDAFNKATEALKRLKSEFTQVVDAVMDPEKTSWITKGFVGAGVISGAFNIASALHIGDMHFDNVFATVMCLVAGGMSYYVDREAAKDKEAFERQFPPVEELQNRGQRDQKISEIIGALKNNAAMNERDAPRPHKL